MDNRSRNQLLIAAIALVLGSQPALAQQREASGQLEEIVVTAQKREQTLLDVPLSVEAIGGEKLRDEGINSVAELVQLVPGASQTFKASAGFEVLQVRGVSSGAIGDALVGYYIDEIPFSLPNVQYIPPINLFDVSRVEVLRGPQGTLYGQSSMGGAMRVITNKPALADFEGEVLGGYSSIDGGWTGYKADMMLDLPIKKDVFGLRITGGKSKEESFIEQTGDIKSDNIRVRGLLRATDDLSIDLTAWVVNSEQDDYAYGQPANPYRGVTDPAQPRGVDTDVKLYNATINYSMDAADLVSSTSYMDHNFTYVYSLPQLNNLGLGPWLSNNEVGTRVVTEELRVASKPGGAFNWIAGIFYQDSTLDADTTQGWPVLAPLNLGTAYWLVSHAALDSESYGLFGEISGNWMDGKLIPTFGLRYYHDDRQSDGTTNGVKEAVGRTFSSTNPRFNLAYKPDDGQLYYLNVAKGFRSGALQSQQAVNAAVAAGLSAERLMPEDHLWSYEVGGKWTFESPVSLEVAIYQMDWKDAQMTLLLVNAQTGVTTTVVAGGADVRGRGIDVGLRWATPLEGLSFQLAGNYNETEFTSAPKGVTAKVGDQIPGSPKSSGTIAATYRTDVGSLRFSSNLSFSYRDEQTEMATGQSSDSVEDLSLRLGLGGEHWEASIYGTNLTNDKGVAAVLNALVVNPIQPRKYGVDLGFKF